MHKKIQIIRSRIKNAYSILESCRLCPRRCDINRLKHETGFCGVGFLPVVSSDNLHFGEEPPISGVHGSGTIFFAGCNLGCIFCQNYPISHLRHGNQISLSKLSDLMLRLQYLGAHNINFVTPTPFAPQIMGALLIAYQKGLHLPVVYNCGGYESLEMIQLWDGIIDIYMPDMKYSNAVHSEHYSNAENYPENNKTIVLEMYRQVGNLLINNNGLAVKGLLIRHLVMPENISGTKDVLRFISEEISKNTAISLMSQYFPAYRAIGSPPIDRKISASEYSAAKKVLSKYGLTNGWIQK